MMDVDQFIAQLIQRQDIYPALQYAVGVKANVDETVMTRWIVAHWLFHDIGTSSIIALSDRPFWMMVGHAHERLPRGSYSPASRISTRVTIAGLEFAYPDPQQALNELLTCNDYPQLVKALGAWACFTPLDYVYIGQSLSLYGKVINLMAMDFAEVGNLKHLSSDPNKLVAETTIGHFGEGRWDCIPEALLSLHKYWLHTSVGYAPGQERAEVDRRRRKMALTRCPISSMKFEW
jgi:hypothetical protein